MNVLLFLLALAGAPSFMREHRSRGYECELMRVEARVSGNTPL